MARAIVGKAGGIVPGRPDLGEFAAIPADMFRRLNLPTQEELNGESLQRWNQNSQSKQPLELRESLVKYLKVTKRQGRGDSFFETGSRGAIAPREVDDSVALGRYHDSAEVISVASITLYAFRSFATEDSVERIRGWRRDIERVLPPLLLDHFDQVDDDVRYLLEGAPSEPGGLFAPHDDAEERFRQRHIDRLVDPHHTQARERLEDDAFPDEEGWEPESEDEAVSDIDDDDDDENADGSRCERLFNLVGRALVILIVAVCVGVQYYVLVFLED